MKPTKLSKTSLYVGCFSFDWPDNRSKGSFQMVVEATSPLDAVSRFEARIRELQSAGDSAFSGVSAVFIEGMVRVSKPPEHGLLVNWELIQQVPDDLIRVRCLMGSEPGCIEFYSYGTAEEMNGGLVEPFLDFNGSPANEAKPERG